MGTGGSKTHESFTIEPTADAPEAPGDTDTEPADPALGPAQDAITQIAQWTPAGEDGAADYEDLAARVAHAQDLIATAGADPELTAAATAQLAAAAQAALAAVPAEGLNAMAASQGFEHPTLVGLSAGGTHPLAHWLNPAYPTDIASKAKIAAKADERYAALAAGSTINGLTLADVKAAEAHLPPSPPPPDTWAATPADVVAAQADLHTALTQLAGHHGQPHERLAAVIAAENHLATASCPDLGTGLTDAHAAAKAAVDQAMVGKLTAHSVGPLVAGDQAGQLPANAPSVLTPSEAVALLRRSTPADQCAALEVFAAQRQQQLAQFKAAAAHHAAHASAGLWTPPTVTLPPLDGENGTAAMVAFATNAAELYSLQPEVKAWASKALAPEPGLAGMNLAYQTKLSTGFRAWAKDQKLADLRQAAGELGLAHPSAASRAEAQNYIAASWDNTLDKDTIASTVAAKAAPKPKPGPKPPTTAPPASSASPATPPKPSPAAVPGDKKSFAARHLALVQALKHHAASHEVLPERVDASQVAAWTFTPGPAQAVGGAHTKSFHTAPDGSVWMFKPDKTAGGARAHAEAAASEIFSRAGVPSVPVYARTVGGKAGSIQPLVPNATDLSAHPSTWSQADVDAIVRYHVAAWAVGDHDGKPDNLLRTSAGGIVPIDQGQAFKFFGQDTLATSYHPNASFGAARPVYHQAYAAAKTGNLAAGVTIRPEAALPVIKAFESISDDQYRALLHTTAHDGATRGNVHWVEPIRARAAARLGKTQVSSAEVAQELLDHAVDRKNSLRSAFASFFSAEGLGGANKITGVA